MEIMIQLTIITAMLIAIGFACRKQRHKIRHSGRIVEIMELETWMSCAFILAFVVALSGILWEIMK